MTDHLTFDWRVYFSRPIHFSRTLVCGLFKNLWFLCRRYFKVPLPILLAALPPKLNFACAYNTASYAGYITQCNSSNSLHPSLNELHSIKEIIWMHSLTYRPRLKKNRWSKFCLGPKIRTSRQAQPRKKKDRHNPESTPKFNADSPSSVFLKSVNQFDLLQKSTIHVPFEGAVSRGFCCFRSILC